MAQPKGFSTSRLSSRAKPSYRKTPKTNPDLGSEVTAPVSSGSTLPTLAMPKQQTALIPDPLVGEMQHLTPVPSTSTFPSSTQSTRIPQRFIDNLPMGPTPIPLLPVVPPVTRRVILHVHDFFRSMINPFSILREYYHRPSYDPDAHVKPEDLANFLVEPPSDPMPTTASHPPPPWPFENMSKYLLMNWFHSGGNQKSEGEVNRLVKEVLISPDFQPAHLIGFTVRQANKTLDEAGDPLHGNENKSPFSTDDWQEITIDIEVPVPDKDISPKVFSIPGLQCRSIVGVIKATWGLVMSTQFHLSPFKRFHVDASTGVRTRIYDEVFTSDSWIEAHNKLQRHPNEPGCKLEKVIAGLMFWSDSTHLTNFGTASVWPLYMYFANLSKYIRARPNSGACHHIAYIPYLPDRLSDFLMSFLRYPSQRKPLLTHCKRELLHQVWRSMLDEEFVDAYQHGLILQCADGVIRRVYPRIFTYSADYPEKAALATIRERALCPCPRCMVEMKKVDKMGQKPDMKDRINNPRTFMATLVKSARDCIYRLGYSIASEKIDITLKPFSLMPTMNAFVDKLGPLEFDPYPMFVVDLMHEFELGVWKASFIHILRVLNVAAPAGKFLTQLNERFRQIPTFGTSTIRRFSNNVSQMKKLAARDYEDILQDMIPAVDGILDEPHNSMILTVLYRLAEWHALAKLRMHTEHTLTYLEKSTTTLGKELRKFRDTSLTSFKCQELPKETAARQRRKERAQAKKAGNDATAAPLPSKDPPLPPKNKTLNLFTYKFHALGDYVRTIRFFGTTDSYSTQIGELAHRLVKRFYSRTNKTRPAKHISKQERRHTRLQQARDAAKANHHRKHAHHVGFSDNDHLPTSSIDLHHHISDSSRYPQHLLSFVNELPGDPSKKNFIPKLKKHLLGRLRNIDFDGDEKPISNSEQNTVRIVGDRIYSAKVFRVNYTTYDMRRDQDSMNPRTHCDVMVISRETTKNHHPFWYARVLGVFHAKVIHTGPQSVNHSVQHMEFLWVRWFGIEPGYRSGSTPARLPKIGFVPDSGSPACPYPDDTTHLKPDNGAFGFLDPSLVLRGCHLVPCFHRGRTSDLLSTTAPTAARSPGESDDWVNYYVIIWVDRDMFMRYFGGGIGHQNQENCWTICKRIEESDNDMDVDDPDEENIGQNIEIDTNLRLQELQQLASDLTSQAVSGDESDMDVDSDEDSDEDSDDSDNSSARDSDKHDLFADSGNDSEEIDFGPEDGYGEDNNGGFAEF